MVEQDQARPNRPFETGWTEKGITSGAQRDRARYDSGNYFRMRAFRQRGLILRASNIYSDGTREHNFWGEHADRSSDLEGGKRNPKVFRLARQRLTVQRADG